MEKVYLVYRDDYYTNDDITAIHERKLMKVFDSQLKAAAYIAERVARKRERVRRLWPDCAIVDVSDWFDFDEDGRVIDGHGIWCHDDEWNRTWFYSCEPMDVE